ncbi:NADPH:quinone oxidoreductase family protein [soil metagenome]
MKAWMLREIGGLQNLELKEVADPAPAPGEAVIELQYAALNPADRYLAEGQYPAKPAFPHILGREGIGKVVAVGNAVISPRLGEVRVLLRGEAGVNRPGTFAQRVSVPVEYLAPKPAGWSDTEAAGAALVYCTAYQALTMWEVLAANSYVLITGASGGVGTASVLLAKAMGYRVIALSRSSEKQEKLLALGAEIVVNPDSPNWQQDVKQGLDGRRVDLAIDNIGGPVLPQVIETLGDRGRVSVVGRLAGPVPQFNSASLLFSRMRIGGVQVGAYTANEVNEAWKKIVGLLARTGQRPVVDQIFEFSDLPAAFNRLAAGPMGKVLLKVR